MLARIGLIEILMILFIVVSTAVIIVSMIYIIKKSLKKRVDMEDKVRKLEEEIDELKKKL